MVLEKRSFTVVINSKKYESYSASSPSLAAKKVKNKNGEFYLKETTKGSKKKVYGPYSSKKKIIQKGGDFNARKKICVDILTRLIDFHKKDTDDEDNVYSVKKAFEAFGIYRLYSGNPLFHNLIEECRRKIQDPVFSTLISSGGIQLTEEEIKNEAAFYDKEEYKKKVGGAYLTKKNWVNFSNYLKAHVRMIEIRQNACSEMEDFIEQYDPTSNIPLSHKKYFLLLKSCQTLEINDKPDKYNILRRIISLRNMKDASCFFNILFSDDLPEAEEKDFIRNNVVMFGKYLGRIPDGVLPNKSTILTLIPIITKLWINFLIELREIRVMWEASEALRLQSNQNPNNKSNFARAGPATHLQSNQNQNNNSNFARAGPATNLQPRQNLNNNSNKKPAKLTEAEITESELNNLDLALFANNLNNAALAEQPKKPPSYLLNENELKALKMNNNLQKTANAFAGPSSNNLEHAKTLANLKNNPLFQTLKRQTPKSAINRLMKLKNN